MAQLPAGRGLKAVLQVSPATRRKLERLPGDLVREFPHVPAEHVHQVIDRVVDDLLPRARFEDFVPLLVHRHARELLLDEPATAEI